MISTRLATTVRRHALMLYTQNPLATLGILSAIVIKAILLFVAFPIFMNMNVGDYIAELFPDRYDFIAWNLASGHGYRLSLDTAPTMLRSPGFVLILAAVFAFFGKSLTAVQILNFIFSIFTALTVFSLTKKIFTDVRVAWIAAFFCFFFPGSFVAESRGGVESALTLCITVTLLLAYKAEETSTYYLYLFLGIVFGFAVLIKGSVALMLPAFWLCRLAAGRSWREKISLVSRYSVAGMTAILISVPWVVRNYQISEKFVPTMTVGGMSIHQGVYIVKNYTLSKPHSDLIQEANDKEIAIADEMGLKFQRDFYPRFYRTSDELAFYGRIGDKALQEYSRSPWLILKSILINSFAFWFQGRSHKATLMNTAVTLPVLVAFFNGILIAKHRGCDYLGVIAALVAYILPHLLILSLARYYIPIVPLLAPFVAVFLMPIWVSRLKLRVWTARLLHRCTPRSIERGTAD